MPMWAQKWKEIKQVIAQNSNPNQNLNFDVSFLEEDPIIDGEILEETLWNHGILSLKTNSNVEGEVLTQKLALFDKRKNKPLKIVFTPIHGTSITALPQEPVVLIWMLPIRKILIK